MSAMVAPCGRQAHIRENLICPFVHLVVYAQRIVGVALVAETQIRNTEPLPHTQGTGYRTVEMFADAQQQFFHCQAEPDCVSTFHLQAFQPFVNYFGYGVNPGRVKQKFFFHSFHSESSPSSFHLFCKNFPWRISHKTARQLYHIGDSLSSKIGFFPAFVGLPSQAPSNVAGT